MSNGVPLSVAYKHLDRSYNAWEEQKSRPDMLQQLWSPERERVCEKEEPKVETPLAAPVSTLTKPQPQRYSKTQILLVWVTIIALLMMIEYFVLRPK